MLEPFDLPLAVRALNAFGRGARLVGLRPLALDPQALKAAACAETGLQDFGEGPAREILEQGLEVVCRSLEEDAALSVVGRLAMRDLLRRSLCDRLLMQQTLKDQPGIFEAPLTPPLIVLGLPRSGTTFLHRLLCVAKDARPLRTYELQHPFGDRKQHRRRAKAGDKGLLWDASLLPEPAKDPRRKRSESDLARLKRIAPGLDRKHFLGAEEPEECMWLLNPTLLSATFWVMAPTDSYLDWYLEQDHSLAYQSYRSFLQLFAAQSPGKRLTLKAPIHTGHLEALLAALPEARLVQTHRDPGPVVGSVNSLFYTMHSVMSEGMDQARIERTSRTNLEMLSRMMGRFLEARDRQREAAILDIDYRELVAEPLACLRKVHDHYELGWDPELEARVQAFLAQRKQHRFGKHDYSLEECGLNEAEVDRAFLEYRQRFL